MLQIATFQLPDEQTEANEFLRTHKPIGNIEFNKEMIFIGYETGEMPVEYQIGALQEMLIGQANARFQQEVAMHVLDYQIANEKAGSKKWDELTFAKREMQKGLDIQDVKAAFVEKRIKALQTGDVGDQAKTE